MSNTPFHNLQVNAMYKEVTPLKTKGELHLARKTWHVLGVLLILVIYHNVSRPTALQLITLVAGTFILVDVLRQMSPTLNKWMILIFQPIMRESERDSFAGTTFLMTGVFLLILFFPKSIAMLALMYLGLADPIASLVGVKYGRDKIISGKSLQGTMAAFCVCTLVSALYFLDENIMTERLLLVSLLAGLVGAIAELVPFGKIDDNFTIPVFSASMLWVLFHIFGGF